MNKISTIKKEYLKEEFIKQIGDSYTLNLSMVLLEEFEDLQQELTKYKERNEKAIERLEALIVFWKKYNPIDNYMQVEQFKGVISILEDKE